ncbi:MAG: glycerophosphodiester phosphodiesterase [Thermodesulfobacteriota bacterium]
MYDLIERSFLHIVDTIFNKWPRPVPALSRLAACKIVSHRGQHDNLAIKENTLTAFDAAVGAGVWGLEFDIRWTRDLKPVVFHDHNLMRVFNDPLEIQKTDRQALIGRFPLIPTLEEVLDRYGGRVHLMVELKAEHYPDPQRQTHMLADFFSGLAPEKDFHFLSLDPDMFRHVGFAPPGAFLPVAQLNFQTFSRLALSRGYAGVAGHFLFINKRMAGRHMARGQRVGVGYPCSANSLFREVNRGVEWIFSNHAVEMQRVVDRYAGKVEGTEARGWKTETLNRAQSTLRK